MKSLKKSLVFISLIAASVIPTIATATPVLAASSETSSTKDMKADGFYYLVGKDELVKATDVKVINKDTATDSSMIETIVPNDFRLKITSPKASLYDLKGKKIGRCLTEGTVCTIGSQDKFFSSTYYKVSKDKFAQISKDNAWI